ncbi:hypothetical protein [Streptomyces sp. NPDC002785]|uniref:hypothetical protein n=1 Tax=Streptomyces sp. NPDC002785 TaxID=3154543 RepID=UPI0033306720
MPVPAFSARRVKCTAALYFRSFVRHIVVGRQWSKASEVAAKSIDEPGPVGRAVMCV